MAEATLEERAEDGEVDMIVVDDEDAKRVGGRQRRGGPSVVGGEARVDGGDWHKWSRMSKAANPSEV